jgi:hypothetical protein
MSTLQTSKGRAMTKAMSEANRVNNRIYYLGVRFAKETNEKLRLCREVNNLAGETKLPRLGFHTTITYSREPFVGIVGTLPKCNIAEVYGYTFFENQKSLVLLLASSWMTHKHLEVKALGATHDYPKYLPHITIAENVTSSDFPRLISYHDIPIIVNEIFYLEWNEK